jgi:hypothetical protein
MSESTLYLEMARHQQRNTIAYFSVSRLSIMLCQRYISRQMDAILATFNALFRVLDLYAIIVLLWSTEDKPQSDKSSFSF